MKIRRIIGIIALSLLPIGFLALSRETGEGIYEYMLPEFLYILIPMLWIMTSAFVKAQMIINRRFRLINPLAIALFGTMFMVATLTIKPIVQYQRPAIFEVLVGLWLVGWPVIDIWEFMQSIFE